MYLKDLLIDVPEVLELRGDGQTQIESLSADSRKQTQNGLFFCFRGANFDAHDFAAQAVERGSVALVVERWLPEVRAAQVLVSDARAAMARIASAFYGHPQRRMRMVGVTGTKGKTTTALLTAAILNEAGLPCAYIGSNGVDIAGQHEATANTTPESLELHRLFRKMVDAGVHHAVLEVSSQALRHHRVDGVPFEVVAFTNLSEDHIGPGEHPDFEDYKNAKRRLFAEYDARVMVYNTDDPASDFMRAGFGGQQVSYGIAREADYRAEGLAQFRSATALGIEFTCRHGGEATPVRVLSPGAFSADDALCAIALAGAFGVTPAQAAAALAHTTVRGRFEVVEGLPGRTFIVDYSHNGLALTSALKTLRAYHPHRLICVFGTVGGRTQVRRRELAEAASAWADYSILTSDNPDFEDPMAILRDIDRHMAPDAQYEIIPDRAEAIRAAVAMAQEGDIVLFAGKGHEDYQIIQGKKIPFVERDLIREACRLLS